jgi:fucose 4-O-acetylase-like acetyltransferase
MKQRLQHIDIAKGLGILLVVLGHNRALTDGLPAVHTVIYLFHMPLFLFLSGITTPTVMTRDSLVRRILGILKPYAVGVVLFLPLQLRQIDHPSNDGIVTHWLWGTGNAIFNTPLWFLTALATGYVAYVCIQWVRARWHHENGFPLIACLLIVISYMLMANQVGFEHLPKDRLGRPLGAPLNIDLAPFTAGILLLGNWWRTTQPQRVSIGTPLLVLTCLLPVPTYALLWSLDPAADLNYRVVQAWPIALVCGAIGVASSIALSTLLAKHCGKSLAARTLGFLGRNTLIILLLHAPLQNALVNIAAKHSVSAPWIGVLIALCHCLALAWFSNTIVNKSAILRKILYA